jgi:hypothetical protein
LVILDIIAIFWNRLQGLAQIENLQERKAELRRSLRMQSTGDEDGAANGRIPSADHNRPTWKQHNSLHVMPSDPPTMTHPSDILILWKCIFEWLGFYSFVLRLCTEERKMLSATALTNHEKNQQEFCTTYISFSSITCNKTCTWSLKNFRASPSS